ncbi:hypothetical protein BZA05DRAFT_430770 [Tricharina praecox]|uniref:uncharacterized protein n=1 Tax=Tricharina praecox TaxID=43433 RepID=UPI00221E3788|nr:uncharacterized protein BZA05DRAFT_430770 [Tricharina praecox]KAI5849220.1 hypothetical protein BZA05DRAFT_430770 [Tricharina praecox]
MAPAIVTIDGSPLSVDLTSGVPYKDYDRGYLNKERELHGHGKHAPATHPEYLPTLELTGPKENGGVYYPLEEYTHTEHGKDADPTFPHLLPSDGSVTWDNLTPRFGSEVRGVQLSSLDSAGKDELALFVAQRGVVAFRDQDFASLPISQALEFGGYFGRHHIHPASGQPKGHPEIHLVHRGADDPTLGDIFKTRTSSVAWHSDVTYEKQPPGTTFLYILDTPTDADGKVSGGDTAFVSMTEAYDRLSPLFRERLAGLRATHSGIEQSAAAAARGNVVRRPPVVNSHPLVRTHPATGRKALFVNPQFTRHIEHLKLEESEALLKFLYDHTAYGVDFQVRVKWAPGTVVVWDNRVVMHTALLDWNSGGRRHLARITPQAEVPVEG